jgi:hypothetical protein
MSATKQSRFGAWSQTSHFVPGRLEHSSSAGPAEYERVPLQRPTAPFRTQRLPGVAQISPSFAEAAHRVSGISSHVPKH